VWSVVQLVLFCMISDDLTYTRATPTFHHWQTGSCSYGLTFQSPSEADTFAKAVDHSVEVMGHDCTDEGRVLFFCYSTVHDFHILTINCILKQLHDAVLMQSFSHSCGHSININ